MKKTLFLAYMLLSFACGIQAQSLDANGWAIRDASWTTLAAGDDISSGLITLPFPFCFNNTNRTSLYINNNGNVSFDVVYPDYTASGFPIDGFLMIAPFWADVDTRTVGKVHYKVYTNSFIVQWDSVPGYGLSTTQRNSFQLIISDGTSPLIAGGNVSFTYKNMQWTTGSASGGAPATVGINHGDGVNYYLIGRFSGTANNYNGPSGISGAGWLVSKTFVSSGCKFNVYVDSSRSISGDGASWASAYKYLTEALHYANYNTSVDSIFVAKGTYYPTAVTVATPTQAQRDTAFIIKRSPVKMYGGYPNSGGIRDVAANPTILSGDIDNTPNDSTRNSYHIMVIAGVPASADSVVVDGFTFTKGSANATSASYTTINGITLDRRNGGALYIRGNDTSSTRRFMFRNCTFNQNFANNVGGAVYDSLSHPIFSNSTFSNNKSTAFGAAMYNTYSSPTINRTTFTANANHASSSYGAAIYNANSSPSIYGSVFMANRSAYGAAISNAAASAPIIDSCLFANDTANLRGGAVYNASTAVVTIRNCNFNNNYSLSTGSNDGGAAIYNTASSPRISNTVFIRNRSNREAGAISSYGTSAPSITGCTFEDNYANGPGGAILNNVAATTIDSCFFTRDTAEAGAAIFNQSTASSVTRSTFRGNRANLEGGAIFNNSASNGNIVNCLIYGNVAGTGGGIYISGSTPKIINTTLSGNSNTSGAAVTMVSAANATIQNSILYGNSSEINAASSTPTVTNCIINGGYPGGTNITNLNPLFLNAPAHSTAPFITGDYRLSFCSPAVNTGNNSFLPSGTTTDIGGRTRIVSTTVDMGAYEKQSNATNFENNIRLNTTSSNSLTFIPTCDNNSWTYYADPNSPDSLSFAINWGTSNASAKSAATIQLVVDAANTFSSTASTHARTAMKRYWNVNLNGSVMNEPVSVRFYYRPADTAEMRTQLLNAGVGTVKPLKWVKTVGNAYTPGVVSDTQFNNGNFQVLTPVYGVHNSVAYAQFNNITTFSGGTAIMDAGDAAPLPLNLLDFRIAAHINQVEINWEVADNDNITLYEIERSNNARDWTSIYTTNALHATKYQTWDNAPYSGNNYYRLKAWSSSKDFEYGPTQKVIFKGGGKSNINIYPNPNNGNFSIEAYGLGEDNAIVTVQDMAGKTIIAEKIKDGKHHFNAVNLGTGTYIIRIESSTTLFVEKMIIK